MLNYISLMIKLLKCAENIGHNNNQEHFNNIQAFHLNQRHIQNFRESECYLHSDIDNNKYFEEPLDLSICKRNTSDELLSNEPSILDLTKKRSSDKTKDNIHEEDSIIQDMSHIEYNSPLQIDYEQKSLFIISNPQLKMPAIFDSPAVVNSEIMPNKYELSHLNSKYNPMRALKVVNNDKGKNISSAEGSNTLISHDTDNLLSQTKNTYDHSRERFGTLYNVLGKRKLFAADAIPFTTLNKTPRISQLNENKTNKETSSTSGLQSHKGCDELAGTPGQKKININLLIRFNSVLTRVEDSFNEHLKNKTKDNTLNISNVLYTPRFIILEKFKTDLFGNYSDTPSKMFERISSTYDALNSFFIDFDFSTELIDSLFDCVDHNLSKHDIIGLGIKIETILIDYLKSLDAKYILSFLPELKSYINFVSKIEIEYNKNTIKGFLIFLLLLKRSELTIHLFKEKIFYLSNYLFIRDVFLIETLHNLVFLSLFFNFWPIKEQKNVALNISTIIKTNCALVEKFFPKK